MSLWYRGLELLRTPDLPFIPVYPCSERKKGGKRSGKRQRIKEIRRKSERKEGKCREGREERKGTSAGGEEEAMAAVLLREMKAMQTCLF